MAADDNALIAKHMTPKYPPGHGREATGQPCWCSACKAARSEWVRRLHHLPPHIRQAVLWPVGMR
jgi:hypothetical protein